MEKTQQIKTELNKTFQMWPANAESMIKDPEEREFLKLMKSNRKATFGRS